jgi:dTDP-glucose pyrophosphorylase
MAGQSLRFKKIGFNEPKWTIQIGDQTMFELALQSIIPLRKTNEKIVLIVLETDRLKLLEIISKIQVENMQIITLNHPTTGQAETVLLGLEQIKFNEIERLVVWCSDSVISNLSTEYKKLVSNHIVLAKMPGNQWSFAKVSGKKVIKTTEKKRISPLASIGLYFFQSINEYLDLEIINNFEFSESYIAPLYNQLIEKNKSVTFTEISKNEFFSLGTPQELSKNAKILNLKLDSRL